MEKSQNMCIRLTSFIMSINGLEIITESSTITRGLFNHASDEPELMLSIIIFIGTGQRLFRLDNRTFEHDLYRSLKFELFCVIVRRKKE